MLSAKIIVLEYFCPAAGMIMANVMFSAPYRDVKRAAVNGRLGDLSPTPWAFMLFNCLGWTTYAILINNLFVFFGNIFALILAVWLNMIALELQYADFRTIEVRRSILLALQDESHEDDRTTPAGATTALDYAKIVWDVAALNTKAPVTHKTIIMFLTIIWAALLCVISLGRSFDPYTKELIIGIAVNINLVFFYAAPLSTIFTVLRTRSCSTIHGPTMTTMFFNGLFWGIFGFAVLDWFIAVPNALGAILGALQMVLCVIFPRTDVSKTTGSATGDVQTELAVGNLDLAEEEHDVEQVKDDATARSVSIVDGSGESTPTKPEEESAATSYR